jgi:pantothenate kinase-related protein Tda10
MKCCFKEMGLQKRIKMKFAWCVWGWGVCAVTHIAKNYLASQIDAKVPLILGVWGGKGQGKSFQTELIFKALDIEPIIMSAGEMESEWAGLPSFSF